MRLSYSASIKVVRVPCTGKLDIIHVMRAIERGADGVYGLGCLEGDCHFEQGNLRARKRIAQAQRLLSDVGLEGERVQMYNLSSSEAPRFVQIAEEMVDRIRRLGPNPVKRRARRRRAADAPPEKGHNR
jgi:coenzyme F420-reducing hydrogenase delta subunit